MTTETTEPIAYMDHDKWGPYREFTLVTTEDGVFGVEPGMVMRLRPKTVMDRKEGREVTLMLPVYERVIDHAGPLPVTQHKIIKRKANLENWEKGTPYVPEAPVQSEAITRLAEAIEKLVGQTHGITISDEQATASAERLATAGIEAEQVEALTTEEETDGQAAPTPTPTRRKRT
jgi:hypothetical protein